MTRRNVLTLVELVLVTGALSAVVYILATAAHRPGVPSATQVAAEAAMTVLALLGLATVVALGIALREVLPELRRLAHEVWTRLLERRRIRRAVRERRDRHRARIGGAR
jgi:hypothetical protein